MKRMNQLDKVHYRELINDKVYVDETIDKLSDRWSTWWIVNTFIINPVGYFLSKIINKKEENRIDEI